MRLSPVFIALASVLGVAAPHTPVGSVITIGKRSLHRRAEPPDHITLPSDWKGITGGLQRSRLAL